MAQVDLVRPTALKRIETYTKATSTAFPFRSLIAPDEDATTQAFAAATASTERVLGSINATVVSTDADYASAVKKPVLVDEDGIWKFNVGTGTADANDEQGYIDLADADQVDVTASSVDNVFVTSFISSSYVLGKITGWAGRDRPATN